MVSANTRIEFIPKISKKIVAPLKKLGIATIHDLLFHLPTRYDDFSNLVDIRSTAVGDTVTIKGELKKIDAIRTAKKRMVIVHAAVEDKTGKIRATWFNQPFLARNLKAGNIVSLSGKVALGPNGKYLQNPAYERVTSDLPAQAGKGQVTSIHTGRLVAVYPETRGITSRWLRFLIKNFIDARRGIADSLPEETRIKYQLPEIKEALFSVHFPKSKIEAERAKKRFGFEELLSIQLLALRTRLALQQYPAPIIPMHLPAIKDFIASLPFQLTDAQRRSLWEIIQDIGKQRPMNRLLEGDVGSGKTVVAAAVSLLAVKAGFRVACMAPTEILARQHFETFAKLLSRFGVQTGLYIGSEKTIPENVDVIIGTHALIHPVRSKPPQAAAAMPLAGRTSNGVQKNTKFENLGLVIIDEQHRFGVNQRKALVQQETRDKKQGGELVTGRLPLVPHFLSMTATPIPRTLALTIYGDLDLSILDEMPKYRKPVITKIIEQNKRQEAYQFIREEIRKGRQVFVICPRIETSDMPGLQAGKEQATSQQRLLLAEVKSVKEEYKKLSEQVFPDLKVAMLHGKMKPQEKKAVMGKFKNHALDILVSTSVIEVGVDVPNATVMMIEGAERFGLAQLHQFRGRVGRGAEQSYCFLFPSEDPPAPRLSAQAGLRGQEAGGFISRRLRALTEAKTGFELAEIDLELRGPGDFVGNRQWGSGSPALEAISDSKLVREVRIEAASILQKSPDLKKYPLLNKKIQNLENLSHLE